MYALSKFSFVSNYNKEKLSKQEAFANGLTTTIVEKCDKDKNGEISIEEILGNSEACDKILAKINAEQTKVAESIKNLTGEKIKTEKEEKASETDGKVAKDKKEKPEGFNNLLKTHPKYNDRSTFSIAA